MLLYSPGTDTFLDELTRNADRVFYFDEGPKYDEAYFEGLSKSAEEQYHPRGWDVIKSGHRTLRG
jgi:hypothetical protein